MPCSRAIVQARLAAVEADDLALKGSRSCQAGLGVLLLSVPADMLYRPPRGGRQYLSMGGNMGGHFTLALMALAGAARVRKVFLLSLLAALGFSQPSHAVQLQESSILREACAGCSIQLTLAATLAPAPSGGGFSVFSDIYRLHDGRYLVANEVPAGELELYSAEGEFIRLVGSSGQGPGEFGFIREIFRMAGDSIGVTDLTNLRLTVLDENLKVARTAPLPVRHREAVAVGPHVVVNGKVRTPEHAGYPFHVADGSEIARSFGADTAVFRGDLLGINNRPMTGSPTGMWAAFMGQYVLDHFDPLGVRTKRLVRDVDWFEPWGTISLPTPDTPPSPQVVRLSADPEGRLWTVLHMASPEWARHLTERVVDGRTTYSFEALDGIYDSVIEVIDPEEGTILATARMDEILFAFADSHHVASVREGPDLLPRIDVWTIAVSR